MCADPQAESAVPARILHCYADYKWTGPTGPVLRLCQRLTRRGWPCELACMAHPPGDDQLVQRAQDRGVRLIEAFRYGSRPWPWRFAGDARSIRRLVREGDYALVHCHGSRDHLVAGRGLGRRGRARTPILRTDHAARELRRSLLWRSYFGPFTIDHLVVLSDRCRAQAVDRLRISPERVTTVRGAVDAEVFRPAEPPGGIRGQFGLTPEDVVIGVVARVQEHRRFEVLLEAAAIVRARDPRVKVVVCGRGTHKKAILDRPIARMGLEETVLPLGYRRDDYRQVLAMFDAGLMLVPGSDGSCRAAMEMAAMQKPLIVARRGVLPDIVRDGQTGIVVDDTPEKLSLAMLEMAADPGARQRWGRAARRRMKALFNPERECDETIAVYRRLLGRPGG